MKYEIEIDGLPEGYKITKVKYNPTPQLNESSNFKVEYEKIQPRRIVLEETDEYRVPTQFEYGQVRDRSFILQTEDIFISYPCRIWREVKENEDAK